MNKRSAIVIATAAIGAFALFGAQSATAATFKVRNTHDTGPGSLRKAIGRANDNGKNLDKIPIKATGTIGIGRSLPHLHSDLVIRGPGARRLTVRVEHKFGSDVFRNRGHAVSLSGITITRADEAAVNYGGGTFTLSHVVLRRNRFAIQNNTVTVSHSTVSHNLQGLAVFGGTITSSTVSANDSGIINVERTLTVSRSTLGNNHKSVTNRDGGTVAISQSTLSASRRRAKSAIVNSDQSSETTLQSTIVANSSGVDCGGPGPVTSLGHNLVDDDTCNLTAQGDQPNTDPLLRPLDEYGGPTKTFALRANSPAVDAGFAGDTPTDQRGLPRIVDYPGVPKAVGGDNSDIGAFELEAP